MTFCLEGKEPLCSAVDVRKAPAPPNGHGLRPPVGSLLAAKRAQPFRSKARKGVPVVSPSNSPILPKTRAPYLKGEDEHFFMPLMGENAGEPTSDHEFLFETLCCRFTEKKFFRSLRAGRPCFSVVRRRSHNMILQKRKTACSCPPLENSCRCCLPACCA